MTRKRIEQKITKFTRLPGNAIVMSLMAVILLCGAPALISSIDKNSEFTNSVSSELSVIGDGLDVKGYWKDVVPDDIDKSFSGVIDGNTIIASVNDVSAIEHLNQYRISLFDSDILTDLDKIVLKSDTPMRDNYVRLVADGVSYYFDKSDDGTEYVFNPSSVDMIYLAESEVFQIVVWPEVHDGTIELEITPYTRYTIAYGEIVIGATGVLLMICALLATPWFGLSGYTGPKIKRRR